jgi:hypothetical protein
MVSNQVMAPSAEGCEVVEFLMAKPRIGPMMDLEVIRAVTEPTPISISRQTRLTDVPPGG